MGDVKTSGVLREIAAVIEERGWAQRVSVDGSVCWVAAAWVVAGEGGHRQATMEMRNRLPRPWRNIVTWNDAPGRTQAEVVAQTLATANKLEQQGL